ncbi:hypothetical protein [uncultured Alsobacter sp.]|uniref:hypothetical protein n=1 Tax=uncultured Alsobacter sp. TaxID=1748258 RepID=UPI0025CE1338|nr:hypothetical protein [uncultured Alsobacter sp.]
MLRASALALSALFLGAMAAAVPAEAAPKRSREVTIRARSYFDAGVIVKPGSTGATNYVLVGQSMGSPPYGNASIGGGETLPGRFYVPNCCGVTVNTPNFYWR